MHNREIVRTWFDSVWNQKNPATIAQLMSPDAAGVTETGEVTSPAEFKKAVYDPLVAAFPDVKISLDGIVTEGDEAAVRWTILATHTGPLAHLRPSGRRVKFSGMTWLKFKDGKIVGGADSYNLDGLLAALSEGRESATVTLIK